MNVLSENFLIVSIIGLKTHECFPLFLQRELSFVTPCLLAWTMYLFQEGYTVRGKSQICLCE